MRLCPGLCSDQYILVRIGQNCSVPLRLCCSMLSIVPPSPPATKPLPLCLLVLPPPFIFVFVGSFAFSSFPSLHRFALFFLFLFRSSFSSLPSFPPPARYQFVLVLERGRTDQYLKLWVKPRFTLQ